MGARCWEHPICGWGRLWGRTGITGWAGQLWRLLRQELLRGSRMDPWCGARLCWQEGTALFPGASSTAGCQLQRVAAGEQEEGVLVSVGCSGFRGLVADSAPSRYAASRAVTGSGICRSCVPKQEACSLPVTKPDLQQASPKEAQKWVASH